MVGNALFFGIKYGQLSDKTSVEDLSRSFIYIYKYAVFHTFIAFISMFNALSADSIKTLLTAYQDIVDII